MYNFLWKIAILHKWKGRGHNFQNLISDLGVGQAKSDNTWRGWVGRSKIAQNHLTSYMNATLSVVVTSAATTAQIQPKTHRQFSSWGRIIFRSAFHFVIFNYDVPGVACIWGWSGGIFGFILMAGSGRHAAHKRNEGTTTSDLKLGFSL